MFVDMFFKKRSTRLVLYLNMYWTEADEFALNSTIKNNNNNSSNS